MIKMFYKNICLVNLILSEFLSKNRLVRQPEPNFIMDDEKNAQSFHDEGSIDGLLMPVYHFNALAMSSLIPLNGTLLDLGSGSGQYLIHLAKLRSDIKIIGIELADEMIVLANKSIKASGFEKRINIIKADMNNFSSLIKQKIDVVSSLYSFHHFRSSADLAKCLKEISVLYARHKCSIWIFDHARPRLKRTAFIFPEIFMAKAPSEFKKDSSNSLLASFSFEELSSMLDNCFANDKIIHVQSRIMKLYQLHIIKNKEVLNGNKNIKPADINLSTSVLRNYIMLKGLFAKF